MRLSDEDVYVANPAGGFDKVSDDSINSPDPQLRASIEDAITAALTPKMKKKLRKLAK